MMALKYRSCNNRTMQGKSPEGLDPRPLPAPSETQHKTCREEKALPREDLTKRKSVAGSRVTGDGLLRCVEMEDT